MKIFLSKLVLVIAGMVWAAFCIWVTCAWCFFVANHPQTPLWIALMVSGFGGGCVALFGGILYLLDLNYQIH
jgi:hypothetical protein